MSVERKYIDVDLTVFVVISEAQHAAATKVCNLRWYGFFRLYRLILIISYWIPRSTPVALIVRAGRRLLLGPWALKKTYVELRAMSAPEHSWRSSIVISLPGLDRNFLVGNTPNTGRVDMAMISRLRHCLLGVNGLDRECLGRRGLFQRNRRTLDVSTFKATRPMLWYDGKHTLEYLLWQFRASMAQNAR
jgi:hypothetical protein